MPSALRLIASALFAASVLWSAALAEEGSLIIPEQPDDPVTVTSALSTDTVADRLRVYVGATDECCVGRSPLAGTYEQEGASVSFAPAFHFVVGQTYTILSDGVLTAFTLGKADKPAPQVVGIYPSGDAIPENTLRFYIQFSAPMQPHLAADKIKLIDADGVEDNAAFMTFKQELWNADRTRLTLLMDPGRIKRGVAQNRELGPALEEGRSYSLVVDSGWPSVTGVEKTMRFEKPFSVSAPLRTLPNPEQWDVSSPGKMTREPLVITFDRPFDQLGLATAVTLLDSDGRTIDGQVQIERNQTQWRFEPRNPWTGGHIEVAVDAQLEDVAGNNFRDLLDHALGTEATPGNIAIRRVALTR